MDGMLRPDTPTFPLTGYGMGKLCAGLMSRVRARQLGREHIWVRILFMSRMTGQAVCDVHHRQTEIRRDSATYKGRTKMGPPIQLRRRNSVSAAGREMYGWKDECSRQRTRKTA